MRKTIEKTKQRLESLDCEYTKKEVKFEIDLIEEYQKQIEAIQKKQKALYKKAIERIKAEEEGW